MTEHEPIIVIDDVDELIAKSKEPGAPAQLWAHHPDEEGVVPEPETPGAQTTSNETSQAGTVTEQQQAPAEETATAEIPIEQQIASDDSDVVATVRADEPLKPYLTFLTKGESNPNLPPRQPLKPFGNIFNRVTPRLPRRSLRPGFSTGD